MKKQVLFLAAMLIGLASTEVLAKTTHGGKELNITKRYRYAQPIMFVERGVEFMIFPDGSFDFAEGNNQRLNQNRRTNFRNIRNKRVGRSDVRFMDRRSRTQILYNRYGDISMINGVRLFYDRGGKIIQIGSVDIGYNRGNQRLRNVGNLRVNYNHWGEIVNLRGFVNRRNANYNRDFSINYYDSFECDDYDSDYHYYKKDGKRKKLKKHKRNRI